MANGALRSIAIYLLRNDLRVHDNECLHWCQSNANIVIPLFCFDSLIYGPKARTWTYKFPRTAAYRARFMIESVNNLRETLKNLGSDLVVRNGAIKDAVLEIIQLCKKNCKDPVTLVYQKEITKEEVQIEDDLDIICNDEQIKVQKFWGLTLLHIDDLPYSSIEGFPDFYTAFRKKIESTNRSHCRSLLSTPSSLPPLPDFIRNDTGSIPELRELIGDDNVQCVDKRTAFPFNGGESSGLSRIEKYFFESNNISKYKETRNGLIGTEYSTKFSAWLANGTISPRKIYLEIKKYEKTQVANQSTYWVVFELLWRDFFKFISLKHGDRIFYLSGIKRRKVPWKMDWEMFDKWRYGKTGIPFVDANMRELLFSGWMSNRGRQNVASFLVNDLGLDWRLGAEWFESLLLDHDVTSNYGNWNYIAGIGTDQREIRKFNMIKQARDYDPNGEYVRIWVPELEGLKDGGVHVPWTLSQRALKTAGVVLGSTYPKPMLVQKEWTRYVSESKTSHKRKHQTTLKF